MTWRNRSQEQGAVFNILLVLVAIVLTACLYSIACGELPTDRVSVSDLRGAARFQARK